MGKATSFQTTHARRVNMKPLAAKPNLRNQQRVDVSTDITIEKPDGCCLTCQVSNLSRSGVMLSCDQDTVKQLVPGLKTPAPGHWIEVKPVFRCPSLQTSRSRCSPTGTSYTCVALPETSSRLVSSSVNSKATALTMSIVMLPNCFRTHVIPPAKLTDGSQWRRRWRLPPPPDTGEGYIIRT